MHLYALPLIIFFLSNTNALVNLTILLDGATALHRYDGHGGLSAGASSRLLWDYPDIQREQILTYLFNKSFGAGMAHLKVEIGGDGQSTDGTEPSHQHTRGDYSCRRGYELWLIEQARARNPEIALYFLAWTAPGWVNNGTMYGPDTIEYMLNWLRCVDERGGKGGDRTLGLWNEAAQPDQDYLVSLRSALDANGFSSTKISIMDNAYFNDQEVSWAQANSTYRDAIGVAGLHDPCSYAYQPFPIARELGWDLWSSEDFSRDVTSWDAQSYWGKALSQHYVVMNITATISWSLIWSVYSNLICRDNGLMKARWPQSGYYEVSSSIWLHAHWGQFSSPGWRFLHVPGGGSGFLDVANFSLHSGTYVSLVPPQGEGLTVIIETFAESSCLKRNLTDLTITFTTKGELPGPGTILYVWTSTQSALFVQQPSIVISQDSTFTVTLLPDSMMTITTIATGNKGNFSDSPVPAQSPWPLPYNDDFSTYQEDSMARYFADQGGSWAVRNGSLQQVAPIMPIAWAPNGDPLTIAGSEDWIDYAVSATFIFSPKQPTKLEDQSLPQHFPSQRQGASQRRRQKFTGEESTHDYMAKLNVLKARWGVSAEAGALAGRSSSGGSFNDSMGMSVGEKGGGEGRGRGGSVVSAATDSIDSGSIISDLTRPSAATAPTTLFRQGGQPSSSSPSSSSSLSSSLHHHTSVAQSSLSSSSLPSSSSSAVAIIYLVSDAHTSPAIGIRIHAGQAVEWRALSFLELSPLLSSLTPTTLARMGGHAIVNSLKKIATRAEEIEDVSTYSIEITKRKSSSSSSSSATDPHEWSSTVELTVCLHSLKDRSISSTSNSVGSCRIRIGSVSRGHWLLVFKWHSGIVFEERGLYDWNWTIYPYVRGTIIVLDRPAAAAASSLSSSSSSSPSSTSTRPQGKAALARLAATSQTGAAGSGGSAAAGGSAASASSALEHFLFLEALKPFFLCQDRLFHFI